MSHPIPPPPLSRPATPPSNPPFPTSTPPPSRVSTAPVKPKHHHIPHHPHRLHYHHHRDKSVSQSAVQPPSTHPFGDALSKNASKGEYEREVILAQEKLREVKVKEEKRQAEIWKIVEEKREGRRRVDEHLRQTLQTLTTLSTATTRRLDYTYYSLLEHCSILNTLTSHLSDLASTTASLCSSFHSNTTSLATTCSNQITTSTVSFQAQATRIEALENRLASERKRAEVLGRRLESVKGRVKSWEQQEREWRERVRMRLRMLWGSVGCVIGVFVILMVVRCWPWAAHESAVGNHTLKTLLDVELGKVVLPAEEGREVLSVSERERGDEEEGKGGGTIMQGSEAAMLQGKEEEDPRWRIFDEL